MSERGAKRIAAEAKDYWIVNPEPGFVIKTKCTVNGPTPNPSKLFINIGHCPQLPQPMEDWDENELLRKLEVDPSRIRVPISVGDLETTRDKHDKSARKVDIVMNSVFYRRRVDGSEFYRQLIFLIVIQDIELKHGITIDSKTHVILRKNTVWDQMNTQHIRKTPAECLIAEDIPLKSINFEDVEDKPALAMQNFRARVMAGRFIEVTMRTSDPLGCPVIDEKRLCVKMNDDRMIVIVDNQRALADFYSPFRLVPEQADVDFDFLSPLLTIRVPIDWS